MHGFLVIQVDGSEETPVGVYRDVNKARDAILDEERALLMGELELESEDEAQFEANLKAAVDEFEAAGRDIDNFDIQFESGFGSWDYRIVRVEVAL